MEKVRFGIISTLLVVVIGVMFFLHWKDIENAAHLDKMTEVQTVEEMEPLVQLSVEEYLQIREDMRFDSKVDSIFINMPEQILTYILVNKGTDLSIEEIVVEYTNNRKKYDNLVKNAMDIQKKYIPDSLPRRARPDTPDTIPQPEL